MKALPECIPCILNQTVHVLRTQTQDAELQGKILKAILEDLAHKNLRDYSPPALTQESHLLLKKRLNKDDLYKNEKAVSNRQALQLLPVARALYRMAEDPLEVAIKLAISGNFIDYGVHQEFDIQQVLDKYAHQPFGIGDYDEFKADLAKSFSLLYITDNAGEIVFDRLLIEHFLKEGKSVTVAVKSQPILNDALVEDADEAGITDLTPVIKSGSTTAGTLLEETTSEFQKVLDQADLVIAKGQGNFETLSEYEFKIPLYFMLLSKCPHISLSLGIETFDLILMSKNHFAKLWTT